MSSSNAQLVRFEPLRSIAFGDISGTYAAVGSAFSDAVRMLIIDNLTNATLTISFDGTNDHMVIPASSGRVLDYSSNRSGQANYFLQKTGTQVYAKGTPGSGALYISVIYAASN